MLLLACIPAPKTVPLVPVGPGVRLRVDGAPLSLADIAGRKPKGEFVMVPLRLLTAASGVDTSALGPFTLVDGVGARYPAVRDPWLLKWVSLNLRRLPLLDSAAKPSGFLIQTQAYRWEVKPLGAGRVIDAFLLYDVPIASQGLALEYGGRHALLQPTHPLAAPAATPSS